MTIDEQIVDSLPPGLTQQEVLSLGFHEGIKILSPLYGDKSKKMMEHYYTYDEDFCQDLVSKYSFLHKN